MITIAASANFRAIDTTPTEPSARMRISTLSDIFPSYGETTTGFAESGADNIRRESLTHGGD
jgi:hypothetical protein